MARAFHLVEDKFEDYASTVKHKMTMAWYKWTCWSGSHQRKVNNLKQGNGDEESTEDKDNTVTGYGNEGGVKYETDLDA